MNIKKEFLYYSRISVSEGLNTESKTSELCLERYDKEFYRKCRTSRQVVEIKKSFKADNETCNMGFKLLQNEDKINPLIQIL